MPPLTFKISPLTLIPRSPFRISRGTKIQVRNLLLRIISGQTTALGEAAPNPFYQDTFEKSLDGLKQLAKTDNPNLLPLSRESIEKIWDQLSLRTKSSSALAALDIALWDYAAKMNRQPLWKFCGSQAAKVLTTSCTLSLGPLPEIIKKTNRLKNFPILKIKLGGASDLEVVQTIRKYYSGILRVDANGAWDEEKTLELAHAFKRLRVELIEQPLPVQKIKNMPYLKKNCRLPLIADENCVGLEDVEKCRLGFHGVNIKLAKCGGLTPALKMIQYAKKSRLKIMIGCMLESSVGISAGLALGARADYLDLDGSWLLKNDPFRGQPFRYGKFYLNRESGLGIKIKNSKTL